MTTHVELPAPQNKYSKILISHANPEDNYFASWLATKLNLLGYEVWCDTQELKGGEDFWKEIERTIRLESIRLLFVISKSSLEKRGTLKELAVADKIHDRGDFIIPIRLEEVSHASFPTEIIRLTAIDFSSNWADGLHQLTDKLETDAIPHKLSFEVEQINNWWKSNTASQSTELIKRDEPHWSNWFPCLLPVSIYFHKVTNPRSVLAKLAYPAIADGEWLITFACEDCLSKIVSIHHSEQVELNKFLSVKMFELLSHKVAFSGTNNKIIELINSSFEQYALEQGLRSYEMSQGNALYFLNNLNNNISTSRVKLERYGLTYVSLIGDSTDYQWHYGIQGRAFLYPEPTLWVSHHIVFTENGLAIGADHQHRLRRKVGSGWYNKQWRDRLLAAMTLLTKSPDDITLTIPVCCSQSLTIDVAPIKFVSPMGYNDPV